ncbi:MAG: AAA family ATPase [Woronichinia naegeliana WA131]|jgi:AAA15 family ATPase/GTPase|uniref:AAA family ATPase n=1 Tax=Woronichinia naegeliana WA131 TaxID=2824559 RepID=A0A977KX45_9CYAN|nr:MAG: AAA family ATPase [Woronichinia naegeliana WA131]
MLIRDLTIQGYRCFEDFSMDGLTRVNLLVGNNNSGKTSFLEAVYLLVNQPTFNSKNLGKILKELFENRNEFSQHIENYESYEGESTYVQKKYFIDRLFYGYGRNNLDESSIFSHHDHIISTKITKNEYDEEHISLWYSNNRLMFEMDTDKKRVIETCFKFNFHGLINEFAYQLDESFSEDYIKHKTFFYEEIQSSLFLSNYQINLEKVSSVWDEIELTPKEDIVIEALRIILPTVDRIGFSVNEGFNNIRLKVKDHQKPIPLSSMGYGMNRILNLAIALVSTEKGVLLIDEIETGLHYEAQLDMWRLVLKTAQDLDVQVFATTHSWDCIAAFKEALQELEDQSVAKLFRLDSKYGKLRAVEYDAEEIRIAVNQGVEVR